MPSEQEHGTDGAIAPNVHVAPDSDAPHGTYDLSPLGNSGL